METMETAKTVLLSMLEASGENGVTAGAVSAELSKYGIDFKIALDSLESIYAEIGAERRTGAVIRYYKGKQKPKKKEESTVQKLAKELGKKAAERNKFDEIINKYRR